jgi:epoxyqueuosine reductase
LLSLNQKIKSILQPHYVDYIGFADVTAYQNELVAFGGNIVRGYLNGISLGLAIPDSIVDFLPERADVNVSCEYRVQGYTVLNERLNLLASLVASFLNQKGYRSLPIAAADRTDEEKATPTVSHKTIAHLAGLGWIGKNCLLITPEHGPRVRFISILTNAPLETANNPLEQRCKDCLACVEICPVKAIKGRNYYEGEPRESRMDYTRCNSYFKKLEEKQKYPVCGLCLYVCPFGKGR